MTHNQDYVVAMRDYSRLFTSCFGYLGSDPGRVLDTCLRVQGELRLDSRLRGHKEYAAALTLQFELLQDQANRHLDELTKLAITRLFTPPITEDLPLDISL